MIRSAGRVTAVALALFLGCVGSALAQTEVADAAMKRNSAEVRRLLQSGADVKAAQADGATALHWAAYHGDAELAELMADVPRGEIAKVEDKAIPGPAGDIPIRIYDNRPDRTAGPVMVFYHGGGWVIGDLETHDPYCAEAARILDMPVVAVDYRLAPEHPFPAAPIDCDKSPSAAGTIVTRARCAGHRYGSAVSRIVRRYRSRNSSVVDSGSISPPPMTTNSVSSAIASDATCRPSARA